MAKAIVRTESGDWYLVPWDKRHVFPEDEILGDGEVDYEVEYIPQPDKIKIIEYDYD